MLKLGSLFDGSGTAPLAATMCGIEPVWASEIEPYPIKVTTARFPRMKHLGSITDINGAEVEPVDIICGGSPCQDLSVAGKQAGLHGGERSHLFFEMTRIIKQMREATNGRYPKYVIWENVPGAFSSNKGHDFLAVLQSFAEIAEADIHVPEPERKANRLVWQYAGEMVGSGWSIAWRTVDAQYWGVPQRRRRIYLVAAYGGISAGDRADKAVADFAERCAGEILFERKGVSGHTEPCGEAWEGIAEDAAGSSGGSSCVKCLNPWDSQSIRQYAADGIAPSVNANSGGGQNRWGVCCPINTTVATRSGKDDMRTCFGVGDADDPQFTISTTHEHACVYPNTARTLTAEHDASPCVDRGQNVVVREAAGFVGKQGADSGSIGYEEGRSPTLRSGITTDTVYQNTGIGWWNEAHVAETLRTPCGGDATKANLVVYDITGEYSNSMKSPTPDSCFRERNVSRTLDTFVSSPECNQGGMAVVEENRPVYTADCRNAALNKELSGTLQAKPNGGQSLNCINPVVYDMTHADSVIRESEIVPTLQHRMGTGGNQVPITCQPCESYPTVTGPLMANSHPGSYTGQDAFSDMLPVVPGKPPRKYIVRRLTPLECCRLQGFPDYWTDGVEGSDSAKYKMWGNGMALPNMLHVMRGIVRVERMRA